MGRYRICNIDISEEQYFTLQQVLPRGIRGKIFKKIVDDLITELQKPNSEEFLAKLLLGRIGLRDFLIRDKPDRS